MSKEDKWIKTLKKNREDKHPSNKYQKGTTKSVYDNVINDDKWSFKDEKYPGGSVVKLPDLKLRDTEGVLEAERRGVDLSKCYFGRIILDKPSLRKDNARKVVDYIPSTFTLYKREYIVLGYGKFFRYRPKNQTVFTWLLYVGNSDGTPLDENKHSIPFIPKTGRKVIRENKHINLEKIETPEWIHDPDKRERSPDQGVQESDRELSRTEEEPESSGDDVSYFENAFKPTPE